jgi:hypothetical protein
MRRYILPIIIVVNLVTSSGYGGSRTVLISEIQLAGETARDEFVELFNPSDSPVNLTNWRLRKRTSSGRESNLVTRFPDITMPPFSFLLVTHREYKGEIEGDLRYSSSSYSVAADNTVLLYDPGGKIVDRVGMGKASDPEGNPAPNPDPGKSIERRLLVLKDGLCGPAMDSEDNERDFLLRDNPSPCNSRSSLPKPVISFEVFPGGRGVTLVWVVDPGAQGFKWRVYRRDEGGDTHLLTPVPLGDDRDLYEFSDITPGRTRYEYLLEAVDLLGNVFRPVSVTGVSWGRIAIVVWGAIRRYR